MDNEFKEFGDEIRNINFGLSSDGINPFANMSSRHSTWPVLLCIYNLPPWLCMKQKYIMLSLLIQGPKQPGNDIDIYLKPLIKDMQDLWSKGVKVYDAYKKETFQTRAMIFCTISDSPTYGNLSRYKKERKNGMSCLLLNIQGKTKDEVKVRKDMEAMKTIPELAPREIVGKTSTYLPPACYIVSKAEKTKFCQCLSEIKVPSGEIKTFGPTFLRDMYPFERYMGILKGLHDEGTLGHQDFLLNIDDLREAHFTVLQHMTCITPYIYEHKSLLKQQNNQKGQVWLANKHNDTFSHWLKNKVRSTLSNVDKVMADLGFGPIRVVKYQGYVINGYTFYTKEQDDKSTLQNSGVTLIASTIELSTVNRKERSKNTKKAYYGVIQNIWELHYNSTVIPLFKCKWVNNKKGFDVDEDGFTTVNLSINGYRSEPFILAKLATKAFYVKDPNDQRLHAVLYCKRHIVGVENVEDEDEYDQFDEFPPFSIGITPLNEVLDDTAYLRSGHNEGLEDDNELALVDTPKRKKRGPAKLKDNPTEPFKVEFHKSEHAIDLTANVQVAEETTLLMSALQTQVLLETEQAEASSPLEDVPSEMIVGHEDTFHVRVSTKDIMKLWNLDGLNSSILLSFEWGL
uniref:DUF4216 domain-containing protein n=1 Tax=Tanacetum cinerariifolium TaxID=118510 RepID=A0A6L2P3Z7_TANCI|nr:hypothetical protein [Tanacetum cinerariifolium]